MLSCAGFNEALLGGEPEGAILVDRAAREAARPCHDRRDGGHLSCVGRRTSQAARYWEKDIRSRDPNLTAQVFLTSFPFQEWPP